MTKQEIERYLEVETVLRLEEVAYSSSELFACPFHEKREGCMKLYPELNGVACMNENCSDYRKVFGAFTTLQKLKDCKAEETRLFGKSLLLRELEELRGAVRKELDLVELKITNISRKDKGLLKYWTGLKSFVLEQGGGNQAFEFNLSEIREALGIGKSTQQRYTNQLVSKNYIKKSQGNTNTGYYYQISYWE